MQNNLAILQHTKEDFHEMTTMQEDMVRKIRESQQIIQQLIKRTNNIKQGIHITLEGNKEAVDSVIEMSAVLEELT